MELRKNREEHHFITNNGFGRECFEIFSRKCLKCCTLHKHEDVKYKVLQIFLNPIPVNSTKNYGTPPRYHLVPITCVSSFSRVYSRKEFKILQAIRTILHRTRIIFSYIPLCYSKKMICHLCLLCLKTSCELYVFNT
ncbi:hypothetical protein ABFS83_12G037400 [Erythranthe nasuta]